MRACTWLVFLSSLHSFLSDDLSALPSDASTFLLSSFSRVAPFFFACSTSFPHRSTCLMNARTLRKCVHAPERQTSSPQIVDVGFNAGTQFNGGAADLKGKQHCRRQETGALHDENVNVVCHVQHMPRAVERKLGVVLSHGEPRAGTRLKHHRVRCDDRVEGGKGRVRTQELLAT